MNSQEIYVMKPNTAKQIETLLLYLKDNGVIKTLKYIKDLYNKWKKDNSFKI